jgi:hypothetical protein
MSYNKNLHKDYSDNDIEEQDEESYETESIDMNDIVVFDYDPDYEPSEDEVKYYAYKLGFDVENDPPEFLTIAYQALKSQLPGNLKRGIIKSKNEMVYVDLDNDEVLLYSVIEEMAFEYYTKAKDEWKKAQQEKEAKVQKVIPRTKIPPIGKNKLEPVEEIKKHGKSKKNSIAGNSISSINSLRDSTEEVKIRNKMFEIESNKDKEDAMTGILIKDKKQNSTPIEDKKKTKIDVVNLKEDDTKILNEKRSEKNKNEKEKEEVSPAITSKKTAVIPSKDKLEIPRIIENSRKNDAISDKTINESKGNNKNYNNPQTSKKFHANNQNENSLSLHKFEKSEDFKDLYEKDEFLDSYISGSGNLGNAVNNLNDINNPSDANIMRKNTKGDSPKANLNLDYKNMKHDQNNLLNSLNISKNLNESGANNTGNTSLNKQCMKQDTSSVSILQEAKRKDYYNKKLEELRDFEKNLKETYKNKKKSLKEEKIQLTSKITEEYDMKIILDKRKLKSGLEKEIDNEIKEYERELEKQFEEDCASVKKNKLNMNTSIEIPDLSYLNLDENLSNMKKEKSQLNQVIQELQEKNEKSKFDKEKEFESHKNFLEEKFQVDKINSERKFQSILKEVETEEREKFIKDLEKTRNELTKEFEETNTIIDSSKLIENYKTELEKEFQSQVKEVQMEFEEKFLNELRNLQITFEQEKKNKTFLFEKENLEVEDFYITEFKKLREENKIFGNEIQANLKEKFEDSLKVKLN